ncbi:MAG TPA: T9SS type A sorting domain-containing protein, partial [Chitinophagales bacterium]|nr:T9SS type A sorting domain-containing protein [Chitinophagales bacterium]
FLTGLNANAGYEIQLRTKCSTNPLTWSDFSSSQSFNTLLRLEESEITGSFNVYPNPANSIATVSFNSNAASKGMIQVFAADGRMLLNQPFASTRGANEISIDVCQFASGVYTVKLQTDRTFFRKLVVQR